MRLLSLLLLLCTVTACTLPAQQHKVKLDAFTTHKNDLVEFKSRNNYTLAIQDKKVINSRSYRIKSKTTQSAGVKDYSLRRLVFKETTSVGIPNLYGFKDKGVLRVLYLPENFDPTALQSTKSHIQTKRYITEDGWNRDIPVTLERHISTGRFNQKTLPESYLLLSSNYYNDRQDELTTPDLAYSDSLRLSAEAKRNGSKLERREYCGYPFDRYCQYKNFPKREYNVDSILNKLNTMAKRVFDPLHQNSSETLAYNQSISLSPLPNWLSLKNNNSSAKGISQLTITNPRYSFTSKPNIDIAGEYRGLVKQLVQKKYLKLNVRSPLGGKSETIDIRYYDSKPLLDEVKRQQSLGSGYIRLTANMGEVDVYIDGNKVGRINGDKPYVTKLKEGRHTIQARRDFYGSKTISVNIEADDAFAYNFDLKPSGNLSEVMGEGKIVQSTGTLVITTLRNDLKVIINGVERIPPTKLPQMPSGRHKMKVVSPQGTLIREILVKEGGKTVVDLDN